MNERQLLEFYSQQLLIAAREGSEVTVWKDSRAADTYLQIVIESSKWCSG